MTALRHMAVAALWAIALSVTLTFGLASDVLADGWQWFDAGVIFLGGSVIGLSAVYMAKLALSIGEPS